MDRGQPPDDSDGTAVQGETGIAIGIVFARPALAAILAARLAAPGVADADDYSQQRARMLEVIAAHAARSGGGSGKTIAAQVMAAIGRVPRHEFVPDSQKAAAYEDRPLRIGHGQTISQPYIVALMTDLAGIDGDDVVLEVGTGSAYQAAVLAEVARRVYSVEIVEPLGVEAKARLERLGYDNVETRVADGYDGWSEHGPFDAILVTAAASHVPPPLVAQLKPGGTMVIPVGGRFFTQQLTLVRKDGEGRVTTRQVLPVRFVPLTGGH